jgi:hypothetical protein
VKDDDEEADFTLLDDVVKHFAMQTCNLLIGVVRFIQWHFPFAIMYFC